MGIFDNKKYKATELLSIETEQDTYTLYLTPVVDPKFLTMVMAYDSNGHMFTSVEKQADCDEWTYDYFKYGLVFVSGPYKNMIDCMMAAIDYTERTGE